MSFKNNHPNASNIATLLKIKLFGVIENTDELSCRTEFDRKTDEYVFCIHRSYELFYLHRTPKIRFAHCRNNEEINAVKSELAVEITDGIMLMLL